MATYICTECGGTSDAPKVCETEGCAKHGEPLTPVDETGEAMDDVGDAPLIEE